MEVCINGTFGAICDVGWDRLDAQVACREFGYNSTSLGMWTYLLGDYLRKCDHTLIFLAESQALNGSNFGPWYGPVYLENVMCNGTESFGFQCNTPGPGVITNQECYNPNRTAGVRCITGEWSFFSYLSA